MAQVSRADSSLFVTLMNGDEVRLDRVEHAPDVEEVTVTMSNLQTIANVVWRSGPEAVACVDTVKLQKLILFIHERNKPAYQRVLNAVRPRMPRWITHMSGWTMLACYLSIPLFGWLLLPHLGRSTWSVMALYTTLVMIVTLGLVEQSIDLSVDFGRLEEAAMLMLGCTRCEAHSARLQSGSKPAAAIADA